MATDDVLYGTAAVIICLGIWMIYPPASVIFAGMVVAAAGFVVGQVAQNEPDEPEEEG